MLTGKIICRKVSNALVGFQSLTNYSHTYRRVKISLLTLNSVVEGNLKKNTKVVFNAHNICK